MEINLSKIVYDLIISTLRNVKSLKFTEDNSLFINDKAYITKAF